MESSGNGRIDPEREAAVDIEDMTPVERREAALREVYWLNRSLQEARKTGSYLAELAGANVEEIEAVEEQVEQDLEESEMGELQEAEAAEQAAGAPDGEDEPADTP